MDARNTARVAYEACRAHAVGAGLMRPEWFSLEAWQRDALINQVLVIRRHPDHSAEQLHQLFLAERREQGWRFGPDFDRRNKVDPLMQPWAELGSFQRGQDALALTLIRFFAQHDWS